MLQKSIMSACLSCGRKDILKMLIILVSFVLMLVVEGTSTFAHDLSDQDKAR